jgi:PilZ domain
MSMDTQLIERRAIISEILGMHLTADALEFALEVYEDSFATTVTFSPDEFCQCLSTLMLETALTEEACLALLSDLRELRHSSDKTMPEPKSASSLADDSQPTEISPRYPVDSSCSTVMPINHKHRRQSRRYPRKPTLLMGTYRHEESRKQIQVIVEDLSQSGVGLLWFTPDQLEAGDVLHLEFGLEDAEHTVIRAPVCVRWVQDDIFGTQFVHPDKLPLAFFDYLQS